MYLPLVLGFTASTSILARDSGVFVSLGNERNVSTNQKSGKCININKIQLFVFECRGEDTEFIFTLPGEIQI